MSNKKTHADWTKTKHMERTGITIKPPAIRIHNQNETPKHLVCKSLICHILQNKDRAFDTEVTIGDSGRVDVLDLGDPEAKPVAYEIESDPHPQKSRNKALQYTEHTPLRDVLILDISDAPNSLDDLYAWLENRVI